MQQHPSTDLRPGEVACPACGKPFLPVRKQKACDDCRDRLARQKAQQRTGTSLAPGVESGAVGAIAELIVSADLLRRRYEVFRAVSPTASCDLLAIRGDRTLRVEVRAGRTRADGRVIAPYDATDFGRQDLLAVVSGDNQVRYLAPVILRGIELVGFEDIDP